MVRLTNHEWNLVTDALSDLTMDPPGTWEDDPELEARLAAYRAVREKIRKQRVATGKEVKDASGH